MATSGLEQAGLQAVVSAALPNTGKMLLLNVVRSRE